MKTYDVPSLSVAPPIRRPSVVNPTPGATGWKVKSLLPLPEQVPIVTQRVSRRQMLTTGAALAVGVVGLGLIRPRQSEAGILGLCKAEEAAFASGIAWLVQQALGPCFTDDPDKLDLVRVAKPEPIPGNDFHNQFAEPWVIPQDQWRIPERRLDGFNVTFGLMVYLLLTDVNVDEIAAMQREHPYYGLLLPTGPRRPLTFHDRRDLPAVERAYDTEIPVQQVKYVRDFNDANGNAHIGMAVARGEKAQLLLV